MLDLTNQKEIDKQNIIDDINMYADTILADAASVVAGKGKDNSDTNLNDTPKCHYGVALKNEKLIFSISNYFRQLLSELAAEGKVIIGINYPVKLYRPETVEEAGKVIDSGLGNTIQLFTEESLKRAMCKFA